MYGFVRAGMCFVVVGVLVGCSPESAVSRQQSHIFGDEVRLSNLGAVVSLKIPISGGHHLCSGTIVGTGLVATASHCVAEANYVTVFAGTQGWEGDHWNSIHKYLATSQHWSTSALPDFALLGHSPNETTRTNSVKIASGAELPTPLNMASFVGKEVLIVGFSPNEADEADDNEKRRQTTMRISDWAGDPEAGGNYQYLAEGTVYTGFRLERLPDAESGLIEAGNCSGDSGGAVLLDNKLIGVIASTTAVCSDGSGSGGHGTAAFIAPNLLAAVDSDKDGVANEVDNCPTVPNADQYKSNSYWEALLVDNLGDACNPSLQLFPPPAAIQGKTSPAVSVSDTISSFLGDGSLAYRTHWAKARLYYRASGYSGSSTPVSHDVEARYCACHDPDTGQILAAEFCASDVCGNIGLLGNSDPDMDVGWLYYTWRIPGESVALGDPAVCPATNAPDGDPWFNDCATPIPNRTFQRVFGTPSSQCSTGDEWGCKAGDDERFWASAARTQYVDWAWKQQDYPHPMGTQYDPAQAPQRVSVRMWLTPRDVKLGDALVNGMYTPVQDLEQSEEIIFHRPRYALPRHRWIMPLQLDPWRLFAASEKAATLLLAPQPPERPSRAIGDALGCIDSRFCTSTV